MYTSAAIKFFRSTIALKDEFYHRQMIQNNLLEPILNIVYETMPRDNLLNSACLELFEFVKRESVKPLITYIVENHRERLQKITYVDTFQSLILRYDQMQEIYPEGDGTLFNNEINNRVNGRWQSMKDMDAAEEAYFNTSDDEDEPNSSTKGIAQEKPMLIKSLVDYPDDDDEVMEPATTKPSLASDPSSSPISSTKSELNPEVSSAFTSVPASPTPHSSTRSSPLPQTPPERISEKRRRQQDDEEDELGKLSSNNKRRSSSAGFSASNQIVSSHSHHHNNILRRKKGFAAMGGAHAVKDSPSPKKIEISLSAVKRTAGTTAETGPKRDEGG